MSQKHGSAASVEGGAAHYERLLSEQESSGLNLIEFARERGLSPWTLYGWRRKLGRSRRRCRAEAQDGKAGFVAVDVVGTAAATSEIEVRRHELVQGLELDLELAEVALDRRVVLGRVRHVPQHDHALGHLQCDAASNFHQVFESGAVIEVGCWAHVRRRFVDALASDTARASRILALVQMLYKVEAEAREHGLDPPAKEALRQAQSRPILERIREEVELAGRTVLPKSALGDAIGYVRNQWHALNRFVEDRRLAIDNNAAERALRGVAVGRKNWLFAGSEDGGKRAATIYSLIGTCKLLGIEPFAYLRDVLEQLPAHPASRIEDLTPRGWLAARPTR